MKCETETLQPFTDRKSTNQKGQEQDLTMSAAEEYSDAPYIETKLIIGSSRESGG